jgi:hypothetical protein
VGQVIGDLLADALAEKASAAELATVLARQEPEIARDELVELANVLERFVQDLPRAIEALSSLTKTPGVGRSVGFALGNVLLYVLDDDDLFDDTEMGAAGLLDDAYLVQACFGALRAAFPQLELPQGYEPPDARAIAAVRSLLPGGVGDALDQTCENLVRVAAALFAGDAQPAAAPSLRPSLRVHEALGALARDTHVAAPTP